MAAWPAQFGVARTGALHHLLLRDQFREKCMFLGLIDKRNQSISVPLKSRELIATLFKEPRGRYSMHSSTSPHGSLFENFDDRLMIGAAISIRYIREQPRTGDKITTPIKLSQSLVFGEWGGNTRLKRLTRHGMERVE